VVKRRSGRRITRRALRREKRACRDTHPASLRSFFCIGRILLLGTVVGSGSALARPEDLDLLPPFSGTIVPIATYGELVPGVAHPGIDLPVLASPQEISAAGDAEIVHVAISTSGYGRSLSLELADGRTIIYAHMSHFMSAIEESCRVRQERTASYEIDWSPPPGLFPVRRGELIGETGETEDGRHLLHLEVRVNGTPRNPLRSGFRFADHARPRIDGLRFVPLGPTARIDGGLNPVEVSLDAFADRNGPAPRVVLWGPIGVESISHDDAPGCRRAPWAMRLEVDGAAQFDGDVGERVLEGRWDQDVPDPVVPDRFVQRLYRPAERDRGRLSCGSTLRPGVHRLRLIVRDTVGLPDTAEVRVIVRPAPRSEEWTVRPCGSGQWDVGVRVGPTAAGDPETIRLWVDQTEDGRRYPVSTLLGPIGSGWFLGEISSFVPSGRTGLRIRMRTSDGLESWGPPLALDPAGGCGGAVVDSPSVVACPRWLDIRSPIACLPASTPGAVLQIPGNAITCELLEIPPEGGNTGEWRWLAPPRRAKAGVTPYLDVRLDGATRRWRLGSVVLATPGDDLFWSSPDGALTLEIPAATFYGPVWLVWTKTDRTDERIPGGEIAGFPQSRSEQTEILVVRSEVHRIEPGELEMDGPFRVAIRPNLLPETAEEAKRLAIYWRSGPGKPWSHKGGIWTGSALVALAGALGEWVIAEDRSEPWLYALDPAPGDRRSGAVTELRASIREDGSGVDASGIEVELDGKRHPVAWMQSRRAAIVELAVPIAEGNHQWEIRARDRAGNLARRSASFSVVR
jgi:hypothetical protein